MNMTYQVEVSIKPELRDQHGAHIKHDISGAGIKGVKNVKYAQVYRISGELNLRDIDSIARKLLIDPVFQTFCLYNPQAIEHLSRRKRLRSFQHEIFVWYKPGVTDTVSESVAKAIQDLGIDKSIKVRTGHRYIIEGKVPLQAIGQIADRMLANTVVQEYSVR